MDAALVIYYEMCDITVVYKTDIAHNACILAGVLSQKLEHITSGAHVWKEFYEDSKQFRDVRNGYEKGIRMCKTTIICITNTFLWKRKTNYCWLYCA